ncbi:hypothetical protein E4U43_005190 [Claviceps pusilla]|uniref:Ras-GTPase-activating protein binding protein 2 n=1 Tax=Claviceps pusilla TaxID=123648 RepID=A0A9P7N3R7_9HYPO|nr:hypothetical protein E4U43_005190 [Claviceps pusilla]
MATNGNFVQQEQYKNGEQATYAGADSGATNSNLSKDEVGWYFVEQYYTTLSKSPEKLHLFYSKRSQFVYGREAEVANVSVGRQQIQERIKALEFQDCKVRVSNVDTQASFDNIVIQVIGETSNKGAEPKKFVQTFVLAQQPSGYFVLNDILRYISEEDEEETSAPADTPADLQEPAPTAVELDSGKENGIEEPKLDADAVDEKLNETAAAQDETLPNGDDVAETPKIAEAKTEPVVEAASEETAKEETATEPEKPEEPSSSSTPVAKPKQEDVAAVTPAPPVAEAPAAAPAAAPAPAPAPEPIMPPKPMTWASRAAAAAGPRPVVPLPKTATPPSQSQNRTPAPAAAAAAAATPTTAAPPAAPAPAPAASAAQPAAPTAPTTETAAKESSGWQTAGADSKRQHRPQSISATINEKEAFLGYVKFVSDKVQDADLRSALAACGELNYFDINRQKNCAFVEFKTSEGYQAALAANPHPVNGVDIIVEPRRPKSNTYGGNNYHTHRGNASGGRGRGGPDGNRNAQGNPRGNFSGQNRGRGGAARGRGGAQANNA